MGQFDVLGKLMNMVPGRSGAGSDMTASQKEMALRDRQQTAFVRDLTLRYVDLMKNASTVTEKKYYQKILEPMVQRLSPKGQAAMAPLLRGTPMDPVAMKRQSFVERFGPPPQHKVPQEEDMGGWAATEFARYDYDARMKHFVSGETPEKINVLGLKDGHVAMRNKEGLISLLTPYQAAATQQASIAGIPVADFIRDNGVAYGEWSTVVNGGKKIKIRTGHSLITGEPASQHMVLGPELGASVLDKRAKEESELIAAFKVQDKENNFFRLFKQSVMEDAKVTPEFFAKKILEPRFPGRVVSLLGVKKTGDWYNWIPVIDPDEYVLGDEFVMKIIPGQRIEVKTLRSQPGTKSQYETLILDPEGNIRDMLGQLIEPGSDAYPIEAELLKLKGVNNGS